MIKLIFINNLHKDFFLCLEMGFDSIDFSVLLEGFSYAYGMDWLEEFFKENQDKLRRYY